MLWGHLVRFYSDLGYLCNGKIKPQAYPCESVLENRSGKERNHLALELSCSPTGLGSGDNGLPWKGTALCPHGMGSPWLAGKHPPCCLGHPCWQHLDTDIQPHLRGPCRLLESPCPLEALQLHITLPVAGDKDNWSLISAGLDSFSVNRNVPQEILGGFCTCLCLFPFLNKVETLSGAFQFCVLLIPQFSLIINVLVKTCLFWELFQTEY